MDIDNSSGPEVPENQILILEQPTGSEPETEKASREARNRTAMKSYGAAEERKNKRRKNKKSEG